MASIIPIEEVERIRGQITRAHQLAAARFRDAFAARGTLPPTAHLELQAEALLETARDVQASGPVRYDVRGTTVVPYVRAGERLYDAFTIERTPEALLEYWLVISELEASPTWSATRLIATAEEYDAALRRMAQPQMVRPLIASFLPSAEWRADGTAMLEATLYTRAGEERIERRHLALDAANEFHFHSRELIAEGRGGVAI